MSAPQFRKRAPDPSDPVTRDELQRKAEAWAILCSQLDDYAIAGNQRGVRRVLNRLHYSVRQMRERYQTNGPADPFDPRAKDRARRLEMIAREQHVADAYDAAQPITREDYDGPDTAE